MKNAKPLLEPSDRKTSSAGQGNHLHRCSATSILPVPLSCSSLVGRKKANPVERQGRGPCSANSSPRFGISLASSLARELFIRAVSSAVSLPGSTRTSMLPTASLGSAICWSVGHGIARRYGKSRPAVLSRRVGGGHPPLLLQQIPHLEHSFHPPASLGASSAGCGASPPCPALPPAEVPHPPRRLSCLC